MWLWDKRGKAGFSSPKGISAPGRLVETQMAGPHPQISGFNWAGLKEKGRVTTGVSWVEVSLRDSVDVIEIAGICNKQLWLIQYLIDYRWYKTLMCADSVLGVGLWKPQDAGPPSKDPRAVKETDWL